MEYCTSLSLVLLVCHTAAGQFSYIPDTVVVPHIHATDYPVWNNIEATCQVTISGSVQCGPNCTQTFSLPCKKCDVMNNSSHMLYQKDKSIFKKACATTGCGGNTCPGTTCIPVGETVTVGVRCWHIIGHVDSNVTATFNIHVASSTFQDCPVVPISGGSLSSNNTVHCSSLSVSCDIGYTLRGDSSLTCCNGSWSAAAPSCNKDCRQLSIPNGNVSTNHYAHGAEVEIICDSGFSLAGASILTCSHGNWSTAIPSCLRDCKPLNLLHGTPSTNNTAHGSRINVFCNKDYTLLEESEIMCSDGNWSNDTPTCYQECSDNTYDDCSLPCDCVTDNTLTPEQSCHSYSGECRCLPNWTSDDCSTPVNGNNNNTSGEAFHHLEDDDESGDIALPLGIGFGVLGVVLVGLIVILSCWRRARNKVSVPQRKNNTISVTDILSASRHSASRQRQSTSRQNIPRLESDDDLHYCALAYENPINKNNFPSTSQEPRQSSTNPKHGMGSHISDIFSQASAFLNKQNGICLIQNGVCTVVTVKRRRITASIHSASE